MEEIDVNVVLRTPQAFSRENNDSLPEDAFEVRFLLFIFRSGDVVK